MDKKLTFIGYGNPSRSDDGIAHVVLNILEEILTRDADSESSGIELVRRHQLDVVDAELVSESRAIVFVDAHIDDRIGDVEIREITGAHVPIVNVTHISSPEELVSLANEVYGAAPTAFICAVRGYDFSFGEQATEPALKMARVAAEELLTLAKTL